MGCLIFRQTSSKIGQLILGAPVSRLQGSAVCCTKLPCWPIENGNWSNTSNYVIVGDSIWNWNQPKWWDRHYRKANGTPQKREIYGRTNENLDKWWEQKKSKRLIESHLMQYLRVFNVRMNFVEFSFPSRAFWMIKIFIHNFCKDFVGILMWVSWTVEHHDNCYDYPIPSHSQRSLWVSSDRLSWRKLAC